MILIICFSCFVENVILLFSWQHVMPEPFEPSPTIPKGYDYELDAMASRQQKEQTDSTFRLSVNDKESTAKESNLAKIKVVVRDFFPLLCLPLTLTDLFLFISDWN